MGRLLPGLPFFLAEYGKACLELLSSFSLASGMQGGKAEDAQIEHSENHYDDVVGSSVRGLRKGSAARRGPSRMAGKLR